MFIRIVTPSAAIREWVIYSHWSSLSRLQNRCPIAVEITLASEPAKNKLRHHFYFSGETRLQSARRILIIT